MTPIELSDMRTKAATFGRELLTSRAPGSMDDVTAVADVLIEVAEVILRSVSTAQAAMKFYEVADRLAASSTSTEEKSR